MNRGLALLSALFVMVLLGLPLAVWMDLKSLSESQLGRQAHDMSRVIDAVRDFYAGDVVARVVAAHEQVRASHLYKTESGAIPIPATFSLELGAIFGGDNGGVSYRFVSDLPFRGREPHNLDIFETHALAALRADSRAVLTEVSGTPFDRQFRLATPVLMGQACVDCHNSHPDSPKRDWKLGDVRAIQSITVRQRIDDNIFAFKWLLAYMLMLTGSGAAFIGYQRRQGLRLADLNRELVGANDFLATISMKIAKYISPQVYKSIFSGLKDVTIATERKKLTIFFSDIQDFTATTEQMQPEDLTRILNEYFTEMAAIAQTYGGTVDKFIGDAVLVFFGDPETKGVAEDARACVEMALAMQRRIGELGVSWRALGLAWPFRARMGINTGFCNVGNFGSQDRMDYTIIGAEANLAARLQQAAEPGGIVMSYETYAHVRHIVEARPMEAIRMKGISRAVMPYAVVVPEDIDAALPTVEAHVTGFDLTLDPSQLDEAGRKAAREKLDQALRSLGSA